MPRLPPLLFRPEIAASVTRLRSEFQSGRLTLFLGAGVSMASGLPSWSALLSTLYYTAVNMDWAERWKPYPNYLFAMGEWLLRQSGDPPEVIAGKVERYFNSPHLFQSELKETLYLKWRKSGRVVAPAAQALRAENRLLDAVARLCEQTTQKSAGLKAVVTTNYDSLLELALAEGRYEVVFKPLWKASQRLRAREKGIFHVHGYLPHNSSGSAQKDILLTEAQYHRAANDPYSWSNLSMIQCFSATTSLMVGMSMTDRNLRRLLHALRSTQLREKVYLVLKKTQMPAMTNCDLELINQNAGKYTSAYPGSGQKLPHELKRDLNAILGSLSGHEQTMTEQMLEAFGVRVIWVDSYDQIPEIVNAIGQ